jgi:3-oxoacyl-[acyl-carrier protein] reductase
MEAEQLNTQNESRPHNYFYDKVVVVTGATSGIGRALVHFYLNSGAKVGFCGTNVGELKKMGAKFKSRYPGRSMAVIANLTNRKDCVTLHKAVTSYFANRVDILINCAGKILAGDIESTTPQDYDELVALNLKAPFVLSQLFFPNLKLTKG